MFRKYIAVMLYYTRNFYTLMLALRRGRVITLRESYNDAKVVETSVKFDKKHYEASVGRKFPSVNQAALHYVLLGEQAGLKPSLAFDPMAYVELNPDLAHLKGGLLAHFERHGWAEGRLAIKSQTIIQAKRVLGNTSRPGFVRSEAGPEQVTATEDQILAARHVAGSSRFDVEYYENKVGRSFENREAAAVHYVTIGEAKGIKPSGKFDPLLYREIYPDVSHLQGQLLVHYEQHGFWEKRTAILDIDTLGTRGNRNFVDGAPTIVFVTHEMSATGAPILGWNICESIPSSWNVVAISIGSGALKSAFLESVSALYDLSAVNLDGIVTDIFVEKFLMPLIRRHGAQYMLANTVVSHKLVAAAAYANLPVVTLVHEFADYIPAETICSVAIMSDHLVFSSELTKHSTEAVFGAQLKNASVFAQGKSIVPKVSDGVRTASRLRSVLEKYKPDRFIIIGCGHFQIRKGVDLFVSAAKEIADAVGHDKVLFLWVGNGYEPDKDWSYSVWIRDQIRRSGLDEILHVLPGVDGEELDHLYSEAGLMFLSSRLDPFPNVAIDAMSIGLPVVCFDEATGVAEHLKTLPDGDSLVAPYLNSQAAGERIVAIMEDESLRARVSEQEKQFAADNFSMQNYLMKLELLFSQAKTHSEVAHSNLQELSASKFVEPAVLTAPKASDTTLESVRKYVRTELAVGNKRVPGMRRLFSGLSIGAYPMSAASQAGRTIPTVELLRDGDMRPPYVRPVLNLTEVAGSPGTTLRTAIHIHAFYPEMMEEIIDHISGNICRPDLFVSTLNLDAKDVIDQQLRRYDGSSQVRIVKNRGRDIGPMLVEFSDALRSYDVVGHIHTKRSFDITDREVVDRWKKFLYRNLIDRELKSLDKIIAQFEKNGKLGLLFPEDPNVIGWTENRHHARVLLDFIHVAGDIEDHVEFPVGNMFFFRPKAIKPILDRSFTLDDFPSEPVGYDGTILHAIERIWTIVCESQDYEWMTTASDAHR